MINAIAEGCGRRAQIQHGVISRKQALSYGLEADAIERLVQAGHWQLLRRGVYSVFTGTPSRTATLWAAVHSAGPGAVLSHQTAAELWNITDQYSAQLHVT